VAVVPRSFCQKAAHTAEIAFKSKNYEVAYVLQKEIGGELSVHPKLSQLGLSHPIIQAGMAGGPTTPELAAVCNAGGMGTLGAGYLRPYEI